MFNIIKLNFLVFSIVAALVVNSVAVSDCLASVGSGADNKTQTPSDDGLRTQAINSESQAEDRQVAALQRINASGFELRYRWVFFTDNIDTAAGLQKARDVMARAHRAGYNGFVFMNTPVQTLDKDSPTYLDNLASLRSYADSLGMEFYPVVLTVGFANPMLSYDPDLIEGLPVKDAVFVVHDGRATLAPDPAVSLPGGSFESATGNTFAGWDGQDDPGTGTFVDTSTKHSGTRSLRVQSPAGAYIYRTVSVAPFRQYHLSLWAKTSGVSSIYSLKPVITGTDGTPIWFNDFDINPTQDWTHFDIVFNSLDNNAVTIKLGTSGTSGKFWIDDASLEEIGLTNVVRRGEYPLVVRGENGTAYTEGVDFYPVSDPKLGVVPARGYYEPYHASPAIVLTPNSSIKEGQKLRVSFYHAITYLFDMEAISLTNPEAVSLFRSQLQSVNDTLRPSGFFFCYDEIRAGNWEKRPVPMTEGQVIASSFKREKQAANQINPAAKIFVWSDMFDPNVNAVDNYFYCNGTIDGSYNGLTSDVIVVNWNGNDNRVDSLKFFTGRGNQQILAGYYDGKYAIKPWLSDARAANASVAGVMYTTMKHDYSQIESFANDVWGGTASPDAEKTLNIPLSQGWNLISVPLVLSDNRIADLFPQAMKADIAVVWAWNSTRQAYTFYTPQPGYASSLTTIDTQRGFWVYANKNMTLAVKGKVPASPAVSLDHGWNLVGNPTLQTRDPASIYSKYTVVWGYENGQYKFYTSQPGYTSTLASLKPGYGYWIYY